MIAHTFGESTPFSLGVEEELMIVDAGSFDQVAAVHRILQGVAGLELPGALKTELFASVFETTTQVCADAAGAERALRELRRAGAAAAARDGLTLAAAGTHPFARAEDQTIVDEERYIAFKRYGGISIRRQGVQGLHVHVGMASGDECWRCLEAILPWLPVVLALSANSPWLVGERTGMASNRAPVLTLLPRSACPPAFASYAEWETWVERLVQLGVTQDYTRIWWDVRPHPRFGTIEVRVPDQPTDVGLSVAFAALIQALCAAALEGALPLRTRGARGPRTGRLRAEPLGSRALRPARANCSIPTGPRSRRRRSSDASCSSACSRSRRVSDRDRCSSGSIPSVARPTASSCRRPQKKRPPTSSPGR